MEVCTSLLKNKPIKPIQIGSLARFMLNKGLKFGVYLAIPNLQRLKVLIYHLEKIKIYAFGKAEIRI